MTMPALANSIPIGELYGNIKGKEHLPATKHQLDSCVIHKLSEIEFFLIPINCIFPNLSYSGVELG